MVVHAPRCLTKSLSSPCVDSNHLAGIDPVAVQQTKDRSVRALRERGLPVHEETDATCAATSLGFEIDGKRGIVRPREVTLKHVASVFRWLAKRGLASNWKG